MLSTIMGVLLTAVFLGSCGAPQVPTPKDEVPSTSVEELKEPQVPSTNDEVPPLSVEELEERQVTTTNDKVQRISLEELKERQLPTTKDEVPRISVEDLKERVGRGEAIVIGDTRDQSSFELSHLAGAIVITSSLVEALLNDLPLDQEIVLYCT